MKIVLRALLLMFVSTAWADTTSGGVTWLDTVVYQKPAFYPITYGPVEATSTHKYWVNLSGGSGTTCTQATPCSWTQVQGMPGTHGDGGGAFIYIEGSGNIGSPTLYGTAGNEIIIKAWNNTTRATITGRNNWANRVQYVIFDGGPNLMIEFEDGPSNGEFDPVIYLTDNTLGDEDHITFYRVHFNTANSGDWITQWGTVTNLYIINSEFEALGATDTANQHHIYFSGANCAPAGNNGVSCNSGATQSASSGFFVYNNIFRDTPGEVFEFRLFVGWSNVNIVGNAMHNAGKLTCSSGWACRTFMTFSSEGMNISAPILVANNLMWDVGDGCIDADALPGNALFYNNTCYLWGNGPSAHGLYSSTAVNNYSYNTPSGTFVNNTFWGPGNATGGNARIVFPPNASLSSMSYNACNSQGSCSGSHGQTITASDISTTSASSSFLLPSSTSALLNNGLNEYSARVTTDYFGAGRPSSGSFSVGAFQTSTNSGSAPPPTPNPPTLTLVQ